MPQGRSEWSVLLAVVLSSLAVMAWSWMEWVAPPEQVEKRASSAVGADTTAEDAGESVPSVAGRRTLEMGETSVGALSDTTLLEVRTLAPPGRRTSAGKEWLGLRVEMCTHADAEPGSTLTLSDWVAETDQGQRHSGVESPWLDYPPQQLPTAPVQLGACHIGWVLVDLPAGTVQRVETVTFVPDEAVWELSVPTAA